MTRPALDPEPQPPEAVPEVERDPDPTPTATAWQEYLAAAQSLDAVRRESAAAAAAATRAASSARAELAQLTARLEQQQARVTGAAARAGVPPPRLVPTPAETAAAGQSMAGPPGYGGGEEAVTMVAEALQRCRWLVEAADRELPGTGRGGAGAGTGRDGAGRGGWRPLPRWLLVAVPLGIAAGLACTALILLIALR